MALTDQQDERQTAITKIVFEHMKANIEAPAKSPGMTDDQHAKMLQDIEKGWTLLGEAIAKALPEIMDHIVANAEIGAIISNVVEDTAVQDSSRKNLIK